MPITIGAKASLRSVAASTLLGSPPCVLAGTRATRARTETCIQRQTQTQTQRQTQRQADRQRGGGGGRGRHTHRHRLMHTHTESLGRLLAADKQVRPNAANIQGIRVHLLGVQKRHGALRHVGLASVTG